VKKRLLLLPLALAACSHTPHTTSPASSPITTAAVAPAATGTASTTGAGLLGQYHWQLNEATDSKGTRIDALFARVDKPVQLDFSADRLTVVNSCNNMGGGYSIRKGRLQMGPMIRTMMACPDAALAALDDSLAQRLQGSLELSLQPGGSAPHLQLVTDSGDILSFTGVPTAETRFGGPGETAFLEVAAQTVPCNHPLIPGKQCLQVRERHFDEQGLPAGTPGAWQPLYQDIEGYTHAPGIRNVLRVKRYSVRNPPADGPSVAYVLDIVVESEKVQQ
jgi:heat shock protein HslJ